MPTFSATGLPSGLNIGSTGPGKATISGTAADGTGGVYDVTVTAANGIGPDASKQVEVTVNEAPELTGPAMVRFVAGFASETVFTSDGFPQADLSVVGALPAGVTFTDNGNGTATLGGTPTLPSVGTTTSPSEPATGSTPMPRSQ